MASGLAGTTPRLPSVPHHTWNVSRPEAAPNPRGVNRGQFYGSPNEYMKIFNANRDQLADPDKIKVGQELKIPAA